MTTELPTADHLEWLAGMIPAYGDYAKEAAEYLRQFAAVIPELAQFRKAMADGDAEIDAIVFTPLMRDVVTPHKWEKLQALARRLAAVAKVQRDAMQQANPTLYRLYTEQEGAYKTLLQENAALKAELKGSTLAEIRIAEL